MNQNPHQGGDAQTTPIGVRTTCPQCGVQLDAFTTSCGACGAVVTGGAMDPARMERVKSRLQEGVGSGYRLGDMLGRGGMGIVFQAREMALDRDVALKVLAFDPVLNPEAFERFEREAKLAARLDHPNIVPIFSVGQGNGIAFYTMRMVRGGSVESLVGGGRALEMDRALAILKDVASALDYAHGQGIVHRDIKPANVLLGESGHAMVADFGIARAFSGPSATGGTATGTGVVGSPAYMSPEQWRGEKVDGRADQYALGVLAFELLAGVRPFAGDSMPELLRMHLQDDAPDIISVRHDLPLHLTDPIRRALSKVPADRFTSSLEFVNALGGVAPARAAGATGAPPPTRVPGSTGTSSARGPGATVVSPAKSAPPTVRTPAPLAGAAASQAADGDGSQRRSLIPWLVLLLIAGAGAGVIWKLAPGRTGAETNAASAPPTAAVPGASTPAAGAPAVNLDSISDVEKRLQAQVDDARRIALAAEHRADSLAAAKPSVAAPSEPAHSHLYVFAERGTPRVVLDGEVQTSSAPALLQVSPGRHTVSVRGGVPFLPADTTIEIAARDTVTVVFRNGRLAQHAGRGIDFSDWTRKLGFDPRTVDQTKLTPQQRIKYRRFLQAVDSVRRAGRRPQ